MIKNPWRKEAKKPYKERSPVVTSKIMSSVRSKNNKAEIALRKELWKRGRRYRLYGKNLIGQPDLVFRNLKVIVFVDGDFWHGRALIEEGKKGLLRGIRTIRKDWWLAKIGRNVKRDQFVTEQLESEGWRVLRLWESEVKSGIEKAADRVEAFINSGN